jgi:hypothetical protein
MGKSARRTAELAVPLRAGSPATTPPAPGELVTSRFASGDPGGNGDLVGRCDCGDGEQQNDSFHARAMRYNSS